MLEKTVKSLPESFGIYQFFDKNKKLLYVGKAKSLKNRVKSYFRFTPSFSPAQNLSPRITMMISQTKYLEYILTDSEHDALILENSLIKQLKPKFNILMRDDKTYPYIYLDLGIDFPRFEITRKLVKGKNIKYFGPFSSGARDLLNALYLLFPLVQKKGCEKSKKACLFYQIKRCHAPCESNITKEEYKEIVEEATTFIHHPKKLCDFLHVKMLEYAKDKNYEEAAKVRDMINSINSMKQTNIADLAKLEDFDLFALHVEGETACGLRLFVREGKVVSSSNKIIRSTNEFNTQELYRQMILDAYPPQSPMPVKTILTSHPLEDEEALQNALYALHVKSVEIKSPQRGEKKHLCNLALTNAKELIKKYNNSSYSKLQKEIKEYFELKNYPSSIEIFDNSHFAGSAPVGAMVSFENEEFNKSKYRHIHLSQKDEYSQMRELLVKRCEHFEDWGVPDLWVIDGGETLLSLANDILESSGVHVDTIAIAKEKIDTKSHRAKGKANDRIFTCKGEYKLTNIDKRLHFFQRLRDEAHRFAITFHKKTKQKEDLNRSFLKNCGLSEANIKKLLNYFGTFENIYNTNYEELKTILNAKLAQKLINSFTKR